MLLSCSPYRGKPAHVTIMEGKIYASAQIQKIKKNPSKPHFLRGDYCSDSRHDVTVYICDTNDSCGLHVEQLPKVLNLSGSRNLLLRWNRSLLRLSSIISNMCVKNKTKRQEKYSTSSGPESGVSTAEVLI